MAGERTLPGLGLYGGWTDGSDGWGGQMTDNMRLLSALVNMGVKSRTTTLPGSPANGDVYLVPAGAASNANRVAIRDNGEWVYVVPKPGWRAFVVDAQAFVFWDGDSWEIEPDVGVPDAPQDGKQYARRNGSWVEVVSSGGGDGGETLPAYRYWRYQITGTRGSGYIALGEWELRTSDGTNVALGKAVTSSRAGTNVGAITDGVKANGNFWESPGNAVPCDLTVDLGAAHVITDARFYMTNDWPQQVPTTGKLLASVSGADGSWVEVADVPVSPAMALPNDVTIPIQVKTPEYLTDAPSDGKPYVRQDGAWVEDVGGGSGGGTTPTGFSRWRVYLTSTQNRQSGTFVSLAALTPYDAAGANLSAAVTSIEVATSYESASRPKGALLDGNDNTFWTGDGSPNDGVVQWVEYVFGSPVMIAEFGFRSRAAFPEQAPNTGRFTARNGVNDDELAAGFFDFQQALIPNGEDAKKPVTTPVAPPQKFVPTDGSISGLVTMTEAAYAALSPKNAGTLYVVKGSASIKLYLGTVPLAI